MNKKTAYVYWGAAVLIIVFGFRTLARTSEIPGLEKYLTYLTVAALVGEFVLLSIYALAIYNQSEGGSVSSGGGGNIDLSPVKEVTKALDGYTARLENIETNLNKHNEQVESLNNKIESIVDDQLDEKVKNILADMIGKKVSSK